jgi:hypothetical protein
MGNLFRCIGIAAGLSSVPAATQALQIVDWGEVPPMPEGLAPSRLMEAPPGGERITLPISKRDSLWPAGAERSNAAFALPLVMTPITRSDPAVQPRLEQDGNSPFLAGLGAIALLMWRRLRRN